MEHLRINDKTRLEQVKMSMAPIIFETIDANREHLSEWLPFVDVTTEVADTETFLRIIINDQNKLNVVYGIWYNEIFAGLIGFKDTDSVNRKTEIGYWLAEKMQHKGIMTACVQKLIKYAFQKLKMNRIQIKVAEHNQKSEAIPLKLNFKLEGIERAGELHKNKFLNLKVYSLLAND